MGRLKRLRRERVAAGLEEPMRDKVAKVAGNPVGRRVLATASRKGVVSELTKGSTEDVVRNADELVATGTVSDQVMRKAIMDKAPKEMDKGIRKFQKEGREITVDSLCREVKTTPGFLETCARVGIPLEWFENLARERMAAKGIVQEG